MKRLLSLAGTMHGDQSWVVEEPDLELAPVRIAGQYTLHRVERTAAAASAPGDQGL